MTSLQPRLSSSLWLIIRHEARILFRDGTLPLVCGVLALMVGWGLFVGLAQASLRDRMIAEVTKHEQEAQQTNRQTLQSVLAGKEALVPFSNPANPAALAGSGPVGHDAKLLPHHVSQQSSIHVRFGDRKSLEPA